MKYIKQKMAKKWRKGSAKTKQNFLAADHDLWFHVITFRVRKMCS